MEYSVIAMVATMSGKSENIRVVRDARRHVENPRPATKLRVVR